MPRQQEALRPDHKQHVVAACARAGCCHATVHTTASSSLGNTLRKREPHYQKIADACVGTRTKQETRVNSTCMTRSLQREPTVTIKKAGAAAAEQEICRLVLVFKLMLSHDPQRCHMTTLHHTLEAICRTEPVCTQGSGSTHST